MDEVKEALDIAPPEVAYSHVPLKASALALKSRAMLYAGTLAYNEDKSKTMGLTLTSGAVGISLRIKQQNICKVVLMPIWN